MFLIPFLYQLLLYFIIQFIIYVGKVGSLFGTLFNKHRLSNSELNSETWTGSQLYRYVLSDDITRLSKNRVHIVYNVCVLIFQLFSVVQSGSDCSANDPTLPLPSGYISSNTIVADGFGSVSCPWKLQALPGQRVNVTLINFNSETGIKQNGPVGWANDIHWVSQLLLDGPVG